MGACEECHLAKVKCDMDQSVPCSRCTRLSLKCFPHESKQGQGPKKRRKTAPAQKEAVSRTEADVLKSVSKRLGADHYGLHFMIRHWLACALIRRSFPLLAKASELASKFGITMDQIFCGENPFRDGGDGGPMTFLPEVLLKATRCQEVGGDCLSLSEIPERFLKAINLDEETTKSHPQRNPDNRWIFVREMNQGRSRFYASEAFQRDICRWEVIQDTWKANRGEVKDLFLAEPAKEQLLYSQALIHQFSLSATPTTVPVQTRIPKTSIRLAWSQTVEVDGYLCLGIDALDRAFWCLEYSIPPDLVNEKLKNAAGGSAKQDDPWENVEQFEWSDDLEELLGTFSGLV